LARDEGATTGATPESRAPQPSPEASPLRVCQPAAGSAGQQGSGVQPNPAKESDACNVIRNRIGQFDVGTVGGPGNPFGRHVARNRKIFLSAFSDEQVQALVGKLIAMAMEGDLGALKLIFQYLIGKPVPAPNPDRVNHEEWELRRQQPHMEEVAMQAQSQLPHLAVLAMQRVVDEEKVGKLHEQFRNGAATAKAAQAKQAARDARRARRKEERRRRKQGG
jgi:hypothetical protein